MIIPNADDYYLIKDILDRNYFSAFKRGQKNIEFLLNNQCENNCLNCYVCQDTKVYKNQEIFIPTETDKYTNLLDLIDWYIQNDFHCNIYFTGCIEKEQSILPILYKINNKFRQSNSKPMQIFIQTQGKNIPMLKEIKKIFQTSNIDICFIFTLNGYYCDNDCYADYNSIIDFIINNNCEIHAKINANNIKHWIKNYKWWIHQINFNNLYKLHLQEVLDDSWNLQTIQEYLFFLDFQVDFLLEYLKDDFSKHIFDNNKLPFTTTQIIDQEYLTNKKYYQDCLFHSGLTIDITTLKIPACSKLNYPIFHAGELKKDQNNIFQIIPINLKILIPKAHLKKSCTPHCEFCDFLNLCEKTCYGENFKVSYNPICPVKNSCDLTKAKFNFLIYKYTKLNLFNLEEYDLSLPFKQDLLKILDNINFTDIKEEGI